MRDIAHFDFDYFNLSFGENVANLTEEIMKSIIQTVLIGLALVLSVQERAALADGIIFDAYSAKTAGRGGTNISQADNGDLVLV